MVEISLGIRMIFIHVISIRMVLGTLCCSVMFLAHLSRRLIGELIVYKGIRRPSVVRPSVVRPSAFSNDISSEAEKPILFIFHIYHLYLGGTNNCVFCSGQIRTLVVMATYSSYRLVMGKRGN